MRKVAIIGTVGLPAKYGGFETLVEQLVSHNHSDDLQYSVYCSKKSYDQELWVYHGAKTEYINLEANGVQSIPYDIISLCKAARSSDVVLILGVSGCAFLPIFRLFSKRKLIINIDGLEHKREKWNKWVRKFLKFCEKQAIKYGDVIITDNKGITDYVTEEYNTPSELIAYGGDHVLRSIDNIKEAEILDELNLKKGEYALGICRIEPENNVHIILEAFEKSQNPIVFVGNWEKSEYGRNLLNRYKDSKYVRLSSAIYDLDVLHVIRNNCSLYLHGHSAGGTNPSLVEAMFFGKPILAFDCVYNRETTENKAAYFSNSNELIDILGNGGIYLDVNGRAMKEIAEKRYKWEVIAKQYENLFTK